MTLIKNKDGTYRRIEKPNNDVWFPSFGYGKHIESSLEKIVRFCDVCKIEYNYKNPCIHHMSDSSFNRKKYAIYMSEKKKGLIKTEEDSQTKFVRSKGINIEED